MKIREGLPPLLYFKNPLNSVNIFYWIPFIFSICSNDCLDILHWMPRDIFDIFQWMPWYFPLNAARYFRCVFRKICISTWKKRIFYQKMRIFLMHFFGLIFIEALKMVENHEKPCFTFFAFLPPYFGVSGSLVSRNG